MTLEDMPRVVAQIFELVTEMRDQRVSGEPEKDRLMPVPEFQEYLLKKTGKRPARQTVYQNADKWPVFEKHGKYLYARKSAVDTWLDNGRPVEKRRG